MNKAEAKKQAAAVLSRSKIKTGKVDRLGADEFDSRKAKFRVNMFVDLDVVDRIREIAAEKHKPYQTLINEVLREFVEHPSTLEDRLAALEREIYKRRA